ncbi:proton-conducting transporter membrane subunit [Akkermansia sp. N21169]|uniref:complex I subunit 4 family protein n=1 Tax=Akkermansia sp. N21169 TaxID=3040765 RepID=UPI00244EC5A7|nr:proton-conducting transporter membrane subunit [Akkermansia sp. N21169]MDH3068569.1 proton-conducting transporter membrane subunit [Akkermansia sp. N21169]
MLIWLVLIPLIASGLIGICKAPAKPTAILSATLTLVLGIWALVSYDSCSSCWTQFMDTDLQLTLAPALAKVMLLLTILVTFGTILGVCAPEGNKASWYISPLLISAGATGAFLSDNILSFFAFHELALIPTFVMIGLFGRGDKRTIAWRITLYLGLASMVLLTGLLMLGSQLGYTFTAIREAVEAGVQLKHACTIGALLLAGFGTLVSLFPFHSWAAPAYASAPTPVAMMHAGVLKKFGLYGLFMLQPMISGAFAPWNNLLMIFLVCNVIWVGYVTVNQKRLDLLLGNSSVMHMGYIFLAFAALVSTETNPWATQGAALLMLAHGLSIALLFLLCGQIEARTQTLELGALGGLGSKLPRLAFIFGIASMASIGLPGLANFPGEFMIFFSGFAGFAGHFGPVQIATVLCLWGLVISAIYMLRAYKDIFQGELSRSCERVETQCSCKCGSSHTACLAVLFLTAALVLFGFGPNIVLSFFGN